MKLFYRRKFLKKVFIFSHSTVLHSIISQKLLNIPFWFTLYHLVGETKTKRFIRLDIIKCNNNSQTVKFVGQSEIKSLWKLLLFLNWSLSHAWNWVCLTQYICKNVFDFRISFSECHLHYIITFDKFEWLMLEKIGGVEKADKQIIFSNFTRCYIFSDLVFEIVFVSAQITTSKHNFFKEYEDWIFTSLVINIRRYSLCLEIFVLEIITITFAICFL